MTSIQAVAHSAYQALLPFAPKTLKHSHVYELLAAAFGFHSWAAMRAGHVFVDFKADHAPKPTGSLIVARSVQLGIAQEASAPLAEQLLKVIEESPISVASFLDIDKALTFTSARPDDDFDEEDWDEDALEDEDRTSEASQKDHLKQSQLLLSQLEQRASSGDPKSHYRLALLLECTLPPDYLYQESLRGRELNATEQAWVDNYLRAVPQFERFLKHLKAAADGGIRAAALLYSSVAADSTYRVKAEHMDGDVDAFSMASTATNPERRTHWLRAAATQSHPDALDILASEGDQTALEQLATHGDDRRLQRLLEDALHNNDRIAAWKWHFIGLGHGIDLTRSTLHAFHEGGSRDGQFYDSDFGGPLGVGGDEGIELPEISDTDKGIALAEAQQLVERFSS